jgi:hypothetical protein
MSPIRRPEAALFVATFALAACASSPTPPAERGWIGGRFADVTREPHLEFVPPEKRDVVGMPASVDGDSAALLTSADADAPLARAGLSPGDLVFALDGHPVENGLDLRKRVEALAPGTHATLAFWRAGEKRQADVVVGRESYEAAGTVRIGLSLSLAVDLWPFNDGINLFDLVRVRWDEDRNDIGGPVGAYRRAVDPTAEIRGPQQESFEVFVALVGGSKGKRVVSQETLQ